MRAQKSAFPIPINRLRAMSGGDPRSWVVVSMFTASYANKAERLAASCKRFGLSFRLYEVPSVHRSISTKGSDDLAYTKANFIRQMLTEIGRPVLFIDADCELLSYPALIDQLVQSRCDFATHNGYTDEISDQYEPVQISFTQGEPPIPDRFYRLSHTVGYQTDKQTFSFSGVLYFRNSLAARTLLKKWHYAVEEFPHKGDAVTLDYVFNNLTSRQWHSWLLRVQWLPKSYFRIRPWIYVEPVINHPDPLSHWDRTPALRDKAGRRSRYYALMRRTDATLFPRDCIIDIEQQMVCRLVDGQLIPIEPTNMSFWP
jgi:hypothetical protein